MTGERREEGIYAEEGIYRIPAALGVLYQLLIIVFYSERWLVQQRRIQNILDVDQASETCMDSVLFACLFQGGGW